MDKLYIVMPAYNEEENIEKVIEAWYPLLNGKSEESKIVVADFGSKDATHSILEKLKKENYPQLELLANDNQFHGPKVIALYDYAIKNNADYIFQTDSDGQTNPDEFETFWQMRESYDGIFGNRTVRGDGKDRAFVEKVVCFLLKLYFGVRIPDANAPFRLMKANVVKKYLYKLPHDYNLPNIMMTTYFVYYNEKVDFKEISFKPRTAGVNSVNIPRIIKIGWKALGDFHALKKRNEKIMDLRNLYNKYKDIIPYLFFGVCTTLTNVFSYWFCAHLFKIPVMPSTIIAWIIAVLFAYFTNRKWVFHSKATGPSEIVREVIMFFSCRLATGLVDWLVMFLFVEKLSFNDVIIKFSANVLVIILNYVASKLLIFKEKGGSKIGVRYHKNYSMPYFIAVSRDL